MNIGSVEIPVVSGIVEMDQTEIDEIKNNDIDNVVVQHEPDMTMLEIVGFLNQEVHSQDKTLSQQKTEVKSLRNSNVDNNTFQFNIYDGKLMIDSVEVVENSLDSAILHEVNIEAWYFPYPKFL